MNTRILVLVVCLASWPAIASGQTLKFSLHEEGPQIGIELAKPVFPNGRSYTFTSFLSYLSGRVPVGPNATVVADLPFAYGKLDLDVNFIRETSNTSIGNPLIGLELKGRNADTYGFIGLRIPVTSTSNQIASVLGFAAGGSLRLETFNAAFFPIYLKYGVRRVSDSGFYLNFLVGPTVFIPDESGPDVEMFIDLESAIGYDNEALRVAIGIDGRLLATESDVDISDRTLGDLVLHGFFRVNQMRPGFLIALPLDENALPDLIIGLSLSWLLDS